MASDMVRVESGEGVRTVTLDRPERLNAVDQQALVAIAEAVEAPPGTDRVIVLRGEGRGFCSGADLGAAAELAERDAGATVDAANRVVAALVEGPLPAVAVVQGPCAGVGVPIAVACDLVVASTEAFFQLAFTRVGLMPDGGASELVAAAAGRSFAMRMALLAERIPAAQAQAAGLVSHVVTAGELDKTVEDVLEVLRSGPADAFAKTRQAINAARLPGLRDALARERRGQVQLLGAPDFAEGSAAFAAKRPPVFTDAAMGFAGVGARAER